jgi:hypothetical protein
MILACVLYAEGRGVTINALNFTPYFDQSRTFGMMDGLSLTGFRLRNQIFS